MDSIGNNLDSRIKLAQYKEQLLLKKWAPTHNLSLLDGTHWYHGTALVVVADNALRRGVISLFHDHMTAGHARITKMLQLITPYYWWPNLKTSVTEYIKGCATCQMTKVNTHPTHPPMFPITPTDNARPFETITMDFIPSGKCVSQGQMISHHVEYFTWFDMVIQMRVSFYENQIT